MARGEVEGKGGCWLTSDDFADFAAGGAEAQDAAGGFNIHASDDGIPTEMFTSR